MAAEKVDNVVMEQLTADSSQDDVVSIDLPAPQGWIKKFTPKKSGTPRRNEIVFIAPTGEEIKNKRQLDQYLKAHSDGLSAAEFDWGTGDTPRRSARISSKPKATETPEGGSSKKKQKRSNSKNRGKKKEETDEEGGSAEDEVPADEVEARQDEEMKDVEEPANLPEEEVADKAGSNVKAATTSVDGAEGKADEIEEPGLNSTEVGLSDGKEMQPDDKETEGELVQGDAQVPEEKSVEESKAEETARGEGEEKPGEVINAEETAQGKGEENPGEETNAEEIAPKETANDHCEIAAPENNIAVGNQMAEDKEVPQKVVAEAAVLTQDQVTPNIEESVNEAAPAKAGMEIERPVQEQEGVEKKGSFEEAGPDNNGVKENQEAGEHTEDKSVNPDNGAHESSAAPPISC